MNLLGYDYAGYGASQGEPSVLNALADIEACYQWLISVKGKQPSDIVLYGQCPLPLLLVLSKQLARAMIQYHWVM